MSKTSTNRTQANAQRISTRKETAERHSKMKLIVRECRIRPTSQAKHDYMRRLFDEGRWYYNWLLQQYKNGKKLSRIETTDPIAIVLTPGGYETRSLYALSSQMRQAIKTQLSTNLDSFYSSLKAGNIKHGELKYRRDCNQVPLKAGKWKDDESSKNKAVTFTLNDKRSRVYLQGSGFVLKITGGKQIPQDAEIANGRLVRRAGDYFLQVTFFVEREENIADEEARLLSSADVLSGKSFDFGIDRHVVDESGNAWSWCFEESERLRVAQAANEAYRAWHKRKYGWARSSSHQLGIIAEENEKSRRLKKAAVDSFIGMVRKNGGFIAVQDEQIKRWHSDERYSSTVHHSVMGGIMKRLKEEPSTLVVGKWTRTTGVCPDCGHVLDEKPDLSVREWDCPVCGVQHDRNVAAARVVGLLAASQLLYPDCPTALDDGAWHGLLGVLGLDVPVLE